MSSRGRIVASCRSDVDPQRKPSREIAAGCARAPRTQVPPEIRVASALREARRRGANRAAAPKSPSAERSDASPGKSQRLSTAV